MRYAGMGVELAASIIGLTLGGLWIDHHFGSGPIGVLIGAGLGVVGGLYNLIRSALRMNAEQSTSGRTGTDEEKSDEHDQER
jgi:F0F1-type ATP synthase assembly protein I